MDRADATSRRISARRTARACSRTAGEVRSRRADAERCPECDCSQADDVVVNGYVGAPAQGSCRTGFSKFGVGAMKRMSIVRAFRRRLGSCSIVVSMLVTWGPARAQTGTAPAPAAPSAAPPAARAPNVVEAERRFNEAVRYMDQERYAAACPLLSQSHALDPSSGTLLNLGDCYEHLGLTASAYGAFEQARELALGTGKTDRAQVAKARTERLAKVLRRLKLVVPAVHTPDIVIRVDQKPIAISDSGTELFVDPGVHEVGASAPGFVEYRISVFAPDPGGTAVVQLPGLTPLSTAPSAPSSSEDAGGERALNGRQVAAIACGVVGVAGVALGTVFGFHSLSKHEDSDRYCTGNSCHDPRGVELMEEARSAGTTSTVAFIVGGVALGTAGVLWFARFPGDGAAAPQVGLAPGTVQVRGVW